MTGRRNAAFHGGLAAALVLLLAASPAAAKPSQRGIALAEAAFRERAWPEVAERYAALLASATRRTEADDKRRWATRLGQAQLELRRFEPALASLGEARQLARESGSRHAHLDGWIGWAQLQRGEPQAAIAPLRAAIAERQRQRAGRGSVLDRITLMRRHAHLYRLLQRAHLDAGDPAAAYEVSEQARAEALLALLEQRHPDLESGGAWTVERGRRLAGALDTTLISYTVLGTEKRILGDEADDERELLVYVVDRDGLTSRRLPIPAGPSPTPLADRIVALRPALLEEEAAIPRAALEQLHGQLIEPLADLLPAAPGTSLTLLPAGALHLVPFAALVTPGDGEPAYLVQRYTLRYALSAARLEASWRQAGEPAAALAGSLVVGNPQAPPGLPEEWSPGLLPGAEREAEEIAGLLGAAPRLRQAAGKEAVVAAMAAAPVLHFASHGLLGLDRRLDDLGRAEADAPTARQRGVNVGSGGVVVGGGVRVGGVDASVAMAREKVVRVPLAGALVLGDDLLFSGEIANLPLTARLAVLSACGTGRGRVTGDGTIGLKWAFLAAGVPAVVSSQWSIPDAPTAELMTLFYRRLLAGETAARALRHAMLETAAEHPHPRAWAAFGVTGVGRLAAESSAGD